MNKIIKVENVEKIYNSGTSELRVLKGINIEIEKGEIVAIVGESGSGKSTLLNMIGGLDKVSTGHIHLSGLEITEMDEESLTKIRNKMIGFVFQFHNLLLDFTALENVMLPFLAKKFKMDEAKKLAVKLLNQVGLGKRLDHKPGELSGGEQQRVAVARALINEPDIILADEPTGNLDKDNSETVRNLLWGLARKFGLTLIVVTHNLEIAKTADRMLTLNYGELK